MATIIGSRNAVAVIYYVMAIDGTGIDGDERVDRFGFVARELLGAEFIGSINEIIGTCEKQLNNAFAMDMMYSKAQEGILNELTTENPYINGVSSRVLIWNLLSVVYALGTPSKEAQYLILYAARIVGVSRQMVEEMVSHINTLNDIQSKISELRNSTEAYCVVSPVMDKLTKKKQVLFDAVLSIIAEEFGDDIIEGDETFNMDICISSVSRINEAMFSGNMPENRGIIKKTAPQIDDLSDCDLFLPEKYQKLNADEEDSDFPEDSVYFSMVNDSTDGIVVCYEIPRWEAMSFGYPEDIIDELHNTMDDDTGIIEVKTGISSYGGRYVYTILKKHARPKPNKSVRTMYTLDLDIEIDNAVWEIKASFVEKGATGVRDSVIYGKLLDEGLISGDLDEFNCDPYDSRYRYGFLMNLSELEPGDEMFPEHPLSELRSFVKYIVENN